jgi:parallel beta-helix repeat protein
MYSQFNSFSNIYTLNNGYSKPIGYGGIFIGGTSFSNTVTNHISNGDITGIQIYDNAWNNTLSGSSYSNNYHGIVLSDQRGNTSFANKISATVYHSTSQGLSLGGLGTQHNFSVDVVVDGTLGDAGVFVGPNVKHSNFNLVVSRAAGAGVDLRGSYNTLTITASENSRVAPASEYALHMSGASYNLIQLAAFDSASNQRALRIDEGSNNNRIACVKTGAVATVSDNGRGNQVEINQDK